MKHVGTYVEDDVTALMKTDRGWFELHSDGTSVQLGADARPMIMREQPEDYKTKIAFVLALGTGQIVAVFFADDITEVAKVVRGAFDYIRPMQPTYFPPGWEWELGDGVKLVCTGHSMTEINNHPVNIRNRVSRLRAEAASSNQDAYERMRKEFVQAVAKAMEVPPEYFTVSRRPDMK